MKDLLGVACTGLCLIHCVSLAVFATLGVTLVGFEVLAGEAVHLWLSGAMLVIALWAFSAGWRIHKRLLPSVLALVAGLLMAVALIIPHIMEVYWVTASAVVLITGHLINRRFSLVRSAS